MTQNNKTDLVEAVLTPNFDKIINNNTDLEAVLTPEINNTDLVGDELNKVLEAVLIPDFEKTLKEKAYKDYLKHQEYLKTYRRKHKEGIPIKSRENYQNNEEYRRKTLENQKKGYYLMRYGMTKEEHLKEKAKTYFEMIENYKKKIENNKSRLLSFEQFVNKYEQIKTVQCN